MTEASQTAATRPGPWRRSRKGGLSEFGKGIIVRMNICGASIGKIPGVDGDA